MEAVGNKSVEMTEHGDKLAVFFPGIGYTVDKPLMHYSRRLAAALGYEIRLVSYTGFPKKVKGDRERMVESFRIALAQTEEMLSDVDFDAYSDILFVGKSIGTILAAKTAADRKCGSRSRFVFYTPLEDTFTFPCESAIVFTGTADPWVGGKESRIPALSAENGYECIQIPEANHSLETNNVHQDIRNLQMIMAETERFIRYHVP